ncbi:MAG: 30S ribosomal protein S19e [Candidatus Woesearchaeota archaeon]
MNHTLIAKPNDLITKLAEELKKTDNIKAPEWSYYVKTGHGKDRQPSQYDWWYLRSAAILRKVALRGPIGTEKLRTLYGNRKDRGYKTEKFVKAGGSIVRTILKQLEAEGLLKQDQKGVRKGRVITEKGRSLLMSVAK